MSRPTVARDRILRHTVVISVLFHAGLLAGPWWSADPRPSGDAPPPGTPFVVSLAASSVDSPPASGNPDPEERAPDGLLDPPRVPLPSLDPIAPDTPFDGTADDTPAQELFAPPTRPVDRPSTGTQGGGDGLGSTPGTGELGQGAGDDTRFREPKLLRTYLPIELKESENYPSPLEIVAHLRVGVDGTVVEVRAENPDLPADIQAALARSAEHMRFRPAMRGTTPVEAWKEITFVYRH